MTAPSAATQPPLSPPEAVVGPPAAPPRPNAASAGLSGFARLGRALLAAAFGLVVFMALALAAAGAAIFGGALAAFSLFKSIGRGRAARSEAEEGGVLDARPTPDGWEVEAAPPR